MNDVKLKVNKYGTCDEFTINGVPFGNGITKLEIVIEPGSKMKLMMEMSADIQIECEDAEIIQSEKGERQMEEKEYKLKISLDSEKLSEEIGKYIEIKEERNISIIDLEQKLINYLFEKLDDGKVLNSEDVEILKILFDEK